MVLRCSRKCFVLIILVLGQVVYEREIKMKLGSSHDVL